MIHNCRHKRNWPESSLRNRIRCGCESVTLYFKQLRRGYLLLRELGRRRNHAAVRKQVIILRCRAKPGAKFAFCRLGPCDKLRVKYVQVRKKSKQHDCFSFNGATFRSTHCLQSNRRRVLVLLHSHKRRRVCIRAGSQTAIGRRRSGPIGIQKTKRGAVKASRLRIPGSRRTAPTGTWCL